MYLTETTRLFTQLWASLQSGEADGGDEGIIRHSVRTPLYPYIYDLNKIYVGGKRGWINNS